jgi:hypothetical protein
LRSLLDQGSADGGADDGGEDHRSGVVWLTCLSYTIRNRFRWRCASCESVHRTVSWGDRCL